MREVVDATQQLRADLLTYAVRAFKALGATFVYLDAGNTRWHSATTMATKPFFSVFFPLVS